jgi:hypothetical protein
MLINDDLKVLFLAVPKTGTRAIYQHLKNKLNFKIIGDHKTDIPPEYSRAVNYFKFCGKRDPYKRFVSFWWAFLYGTNGGCAGERYQKLIDEFDMYNIDNFVEYVVNHQDHKAYKIVRTHTKPQWEWHKKNKIDCVLDCENLEQECRRLPFLVEPMKLEVRNSFSHQRTMTAVEYLGQINIEVLNEFYKDDFNNLGYSQL